MPDAYGRTTPQNVTSRPKPRIVRAYDDAKTEGWMMRAAAATQQLFDEIRVYEGIAERTGNTVDRTSIRGRQGVCRSLTELTQKSRRLGDGYYYLAASVWPEGETSITLQKTWETMS
jgi:hypothetical protein